MSKKTKVVTTGNSIYLSGNTIALCSDNTIRLVDSGTGKGHDVTGNEVAVTPAGLTAIRRAVPVMLEMKRLEGVLSKIKVGKEGEYGPLLLHSDVDLWVEVGCTSVDVDDIAKHAKALGLSLK